MAFSRTGGQGGAVAPPTVWDPLIRITHWTVAFGIAANGIFNSAGGTAHIWIGWALIAMLGLRMVWGVVGPRSARFSAFPPDPRAALSHLFTLLRGRRPAEHASHNPAGAMMVYALWASLAVVLATGLVMTDARSPVTIATEKAAVAAGDWSVLAAQSETAEDDEGLKDIAEEVHEVAANLILFLALLHVAGVVVESMALGRNLVRPMIVAPAKRGKRRP